MDEHNVPTLAMDEFNWILSRTSSGELFDLCNRTSNQIPPLHTSTPQTSAHAPASESADTSSLQFHC